MTRILIARKRVEWKGFLMQPGATMLLDDVHLNGAVFLPGSGMTYIPFAQFVMDGLLEDVGESDVEMKVYNDTGVDVIEGIGRFNIEPMFHFIHEHIENLSPYRPGFVGAEVGVWTGYNAQRILEALPIEMLYLIDTYDENPNYQYGNPDLKAAKEFARERLKQYEDRITWMYMPSVEALRGMRGMLHFCYHDGDHRRPNMEAELPLGYDAVIQGGVWGGHDYKNISEGECEVKSCVDEFFIDHNLSPLWYSPQKLNWWHVRTDYNPSEL